MTGVADPGGIGWLRRLEPRHHIVFACFLATFTAYVERVGFSIALTAMAKQSQVDEAVKGTVLSAFYWGYGVSQVSHVNCIACSQAATFLWPAARLAYRHVGETVLSSDG